MRVLINQQPHDLPDGATLAEAVQVIQASGPFAAAVNLRFVPRTQYSQTTLAEGDQIEIIAPVTGG
jgi:sulfur carrier protein